MHRARAALNTLLLFGGVLSLVFVCRSRIPAAAQTVFQWTDENGTIHFSNSAPPKGVDFQRRDMPAPPPIASLPKGTSPAASEAGGQAAAKGSGPAQLVLDQPESLQEGPGVEGFVGKVKNVGGAPAPQVAVQITVIDPVQGDQCLQDEIAVRPSTIAPGQTGEYRGSFENPCFYGDAKVNLVPLWNE